MAVPALKTGGGSIGNALLMGEQIKGMRQQNELTGLNIERTKKAGQQEVVALQLKILASIDLEAPDAEARYNAGVEWLTQNYPETAQKPYPPFQEAIPLIKQARAMVYGQGESYTLKPGETRFRGSKEIASGGPIQAKPRQKGETRTNQKGTQKVTEEWTGTEWKEIGRGPQFKPESQSRTQAQSDSQRQRLRSRIAKLWGYSEFSKLDETTAQKVEESTVLARQIYNSDPDQNMDRAIQVANREVRLKYLLMDLPQAKKGITKEGGNFKSTVTKVKGLASAGMAAKDIKKALLYKGWDEERANLILEKAGLKTENRFVVRTGTHKGRKVVQYSDGVVEYAD